MLFLRLLAVCQTPVTSLAPCGLVPCQRGSSLGKEWLITSKARRLAVVSVWAEVRASASVCANEEATVVSVVQGKLVVRQESRQAAVLRLLRQTWPTTTARAVRKSVLEAMTAALTTAGTLSCRSPCRHCRTSSSMAGCRAAGGHACRNSGRNFRTLGAGSACRTTSSGKKTCRKQPQLGIAASTACRVNWKNCWEIY